MSKKQLELLKFEQKENKQVEDEMKIIKGGNIMRGINQETLTSFGIYVDDKDNIHFPLKDKQETITYASGFKNMPKYILPSGFEKGNFLYGKEQLEKVALRGQTLYITEGYFDVMSLHAKGLEAVGLLGTTLSESQIEQINDLGYKNIVLAFDRDEPGKTAALEVGMKLQQAGFDVFDYYNEHVTGLVTIGQEYKDINDLLQLCPDTFMFAVTDGIKPFEEMVYDILTERATVGHNLKTQETVQQFYAYTQHTKKDITDIQNQLRDYLKVTERFMEAVANEQGINKQTSSKNQNERNEEYTMSNITKGNVSIKKMDVIPTNMDGVNKMKATLSLGNIEVKGITITKSDNGIFVKMPATSYQKDGQTKFSPLLTLSNHVKDRINFALVETFAEVNAGIPFTPKTLPIDIKPEFKKMSERVFENTNLTSFTLQNEAFLINNMRHVKPDDKEEFIAFPNYQGSDGKYYSNFYADRDAMENIKEQLIDVAKDKGVEPNFNQPPEFDIPEEEIAF